MSYHTYSVDGFGFSVDEIIRGYMGVVLIIGGNVEERFVDLRIIHIFGIHQLLCSGIIVEGKQNTFGRIRHVLEVGVDDIDIVDTFVHQRLPDKRSKGKKQNHGRQENTGDQNQNDLEQITDRRCKIF